MPSTKKPSQVGQEPEEGRGKGRAFALTIHAGEALRRRNRSNFDGDRLQHRSLLVVELDGVAPRLIGKYTS